MKIAGPKVTLLIAALVSLLAPSRLSADELKLVPQPKQVERREGSFTVTQQTRIVVSSREDETAAASLVEEIYSRTGSKLKVQVARELPKSRGVIYLARAALQAKPDLRLKTFLKARNLPVDEALDGEGYVLDADADRIVIAARTGAGLFYGAQTLAQLLVPASVASHKRVACPAVSIRDWPSMRWRGVHDDISRGPVPTLDYMKRQIRTLAAFKLNLYALYIEHVFDYQKHPLIAPKEGALTASDVRELVDYARRYHVTVLPEQQAFGHLHHVLKTEAYADLAETPHGHVLSPANEKSYELIKDIYDELVPLFPGPLFHIGADETLELGRGQTREQVEKLGLGRVYLEHVKRVTAIMKPHGKRLMFWGDIAVHYPQLLDILPKDVIAVAWGYSALPSFDKQIAPYKAAGLDLFVSPGVSNWRRIYPNLDAAFINIKNFVRDGQKHNALGMLNTTWDDDGEELFAMNWPAIVFGAACSWQPGESSVEAFKSRYDWAFYRNSSGVFTEAIQRLSRAHIILEGAGLAGAYNEGFWNDPFSEAGARYAERALPVARDLRLAAESALESLYRHRASAHAERDTIDHLIFAAIRLDTLGMKIQYASEIGKFYWDAYLNMSDRARVLRNLNEISGVNARLEDLRDQTTRLREMYELLWLKENRRYWLGNVLVRYDNLANLFQSKIRQVKAAADQYREEQVLPTPYEMGFLLR